MKHKILISQRALIDLISSEFILVERFSPDINLGISMDSNIEELEYLNALGINHIGRKRMDKILQYLILKRFGINTPKTFFDENIIRPINSIDLFNCYVCLDEVVIKPIEGARGIGVKKIKAKDYLDVLYEGNIEKIFPRKSGGEKMINSYTSEESYIKNAFNYSNNIFQEPIDVKREFRLIIFKNIGYTIYERQKKDGEFLGNLSNGSNPKLVSYIDCKLFINPLIEKFYPLMNELNYPWLSIDVYIDKNDNVGVFEFQMEFAYKGFNSNLIKNLLIQTIKQYL